MSFHVIKIKIAENKKNDYYQVEFTRLIKVKDYLVKNVTRIHVNSLKFIAKVTDNKK